MTVFVLCRNGDVDRYESLNKAQRALESPDVESGEYLYAIDESGNKFSIRVKSATKYSQFFGVEFLNLSPIIFEYESKNISDLRNVLLKFIGLQNYDNFTLDELIARAQNK